MRMHYVIIILLMGMLAACGNGDKLATVGNKTITQAEFDGFLKFKRINSQDQKRREMLLDQYLEREALASVVEGEKLLDADLVRAELNEFRKEMLISRYFEKFLKDKVTDAAVKNYYTTHAGDYEARKVHVAHILILTNAKMSETERKAKLTALQEAYAKIKKGEEFAKVAKDVSEDRVSAKKGGDLGWLKEGSISPVFSKTAFELKPEEVSEPFETPFGFHLLKVLDGAKTIKRPFSAVAGDIRYQLRNLAKKAEIERLMAKVKIQK